LSLARRQSVTGKQLATLALALPGTHEEPHFERTSFRVGKKIFATLTADASEAMVRVAPPEKLDALLEGFPDVFFSYGKWTTGNGALGVRLEKVKPALMKELVAASWRHVAPKKLHAVADQAAKAESK
jgi:hypothetical protein